VLLVGGCSSGTGPKSRATGTAAKSDFSTASVNPAEPVAEARIQVLAARARSDNEARHLAGLATSRDVLVGVERDLGPTLLDPDSTLQSLAEEISGSVDPSTGDLVIRASGKNAVLLANSDARSLITVANRTSPADRLEIAQPATPTSSHT
jgi:hypothetical protein